MKKHTKIYMKAFSYDVSAFITCEVCEAKAVDIHHITARGMVGNPTGDKDCIENLQAVCRECHNKYGDAPELRHLLYSIHAKRMSAAGVTYSDTVLQGFAEK